MSASPLAKTDWDLPPEMKPLKPAARKAVVKQKAARKASAGAANAMNIIMVGSALKAAAGTIGEQKVPLHAVHMNSIDDLLAHIEDHDVACAVVDQSTPTESRGLKLALLAAANRIRHLIVIADPKNATEAEAIHGVHEVLRAPATEKRIFDSVITHACEASAPSVTSAMKRMVERTGLKECLAETPETLWTRNEGKGKGHADLLAGDPVRNGRNTSRTASRARPAGSLDKLGGWLRQMSIPHHNRALLAALVPLMALFVCFGGILAFFLVSSNWSIPVQLGRSHPMVQQAGAQLEELRNREAALRAALDTASTLAAMAHTGQKDASQRLAIAEQAIAGELEQNQKLLSETRAHIRRLKRIAARSGATEDELTIAGLQSMHQIALVSNELAVKEIEETRLAARDSYLRAIADKPTVSTFRALPSGSGALALLAREMADAHAALAEADRAISSKAAEANRIAADLASVTARLGELSASAFARAWDNPVDVVFVPASNSAGYRSGTPLYSCKLVAMFCSLAGKTGTVVATSAKASHPLFGTTLAGSYVEAVFTTPGNARSALVHAGGKPLLF